MLHFAWSLSSGSKVMADNRPRMCVLECKFGPIFGRNFWTNWATELSNHAKCRICYTLSFCTQKFFSKVYNFHKKYKNVLFSPFWTSFVQFSTENIAFLSFFMKSIDFTEKPLRTNLKSIKNATFCMVTELCSSIGSKVMAQNRPLTGVSERKFGPIFGHNFWTNGDTDLNKPPNFSICYAL